MFELIKWEFKKIYSDKTNQIVSLVCTVVMLVLVYTSISMDAMTMRDGEITDGMDAIRLKREFMQALEGELTEERIASDIKDFCDIAKLHLKRNGNMNIWDREGEKYYIPKEDYFALLNENYYFGEEDETGYGNLLKVIIKSGSAGFYLTRKQNILGLFMSDESAYSKNEAIYWVDKYNKLDETIYYGNCYGWQCVLKKAYFLIAALFAVCFCASSVYSKEYERNTYSVILATKTGKEKIILAKKVATVTYALLVFTLEIIIYHVFILTICGFEGADYKVQLTSIMCPYNVTYGQAALINVGISYLVLLTMVIFTLCVSSISRNSFLGFAIVAIGIFAGLFVPEPKTYLAVRIISIIPCNALALFSTAGLGVVSYQIGSVVFNVLQLGVILYGVISVLLFSVAGRSFKKYC